MKKFRIFIMMLLVGTFLTVIGGSAAQASDGLTCWQKGGRVKNSSASDYSLRLFSSGASTSGCGYDTFYPGEDSRSWSDTQDVDGFGVLSGTHCRSQWNHWYEGGATGQVWYYGPDSMDLVLYCIPNGTWS